jgi:phosphotransferase system enzyme I (PtsI)
MTRPESGNERSFSGLGVSGGVVIGPLHRLREAEAGKRAFTSAEEEARALQEALRAAGEQLEMLIAAQDTLAGEILEFQLALLEDEEILAPAYQAINGGIACDEAWRRTLDAEIVEYQRDGHETLAARTGDLADLRDRVLRALHGQSVAAEPIPDGAVVATNDLTPSAFLDLDWGRIGGAASLGGSPSSHVAILARARGVNFLVGLQAQPDALTSGETAVLDAQAGTLTLAPGSETLAAARAKLADAEKERAAIDLLLARPAVTASGESVKVLVNIDEPDRLDALSPEHCDGVGLTRTEFLFHGGRLPDEDEQFAFYRRLIAWAGGRPVTIRTLDAGGDKPIPGVTIDGEANPFLGVRGLRLSLAKPDIFRVQLRALARAAALAPVNVMFPMVTVPDELARAREMMTEAVADLRRTGAACALPRIGMMIEVPAAALTAEAFDADFYSIGSNDLIQYVTASARDNGTLAALADGSNPAVLELISRTVAAGKARGVDVSLCGDMASTPSLVAPLMETGLRALSCAPAQVGPVKLAISRYAGKNKTD